MDDARAVNLTGVVALGIATEIATAVEAATGLTVTEVAALTTLANWSDGLSIERIREVTALSQPGCARLVDRLVAAGLARRARDTADRRVTTVSVTAAGRRTVTRARAARGDVVQSWLATLPGADRARFAAAVEVLAGARIDGPVAANRRCRLCDPAGCGHLGDCPVTRAIPAPSS